MAITYKKAIEKIEKFLKDDDFEEYTKPLVDKYVESHTVEEIKDFIYEQNALLTDIFCVIHFEVKGGQDGENSGKEKA